MEDTFYRLPTESKWTMCVKEAILTEVRRYLPRAEIRGPVTPLVARASYEQKLMAYIAGRHIPYHPCSCGFSHD